MNCSGVGIDIFYLAMCWALTLTTSTLLTTIGPLSAKYVGASNVEAPFTIGVFLFGAAFSAVPAGPLFKKYGRMKGFSFGCICQIIGCILGCTAMAIENHVLIFFGCFFVGLGQGFGQFYRFSAVEIAPASIKPQAVTYVLSGGVLAAILGPNLATLTVNLFPDRPYTGAFLMIGVVAIVNQICCLMVRFPDSIVTRPSGKQGGSKPSIGGPVEAMAVSITGVENRPIVIIITEPLFMVSCAVATLAHTIMVMVMSNATLALSSQGFPVEDASLMMMLHFACMFVPGFFTGKLIEKFGPFIVAMFGAVVFACCAITFLSGMDIVNFYVGMSLLGIAWNFSFSAGTVMLTGSYKKSEAADVQAVNDFILFTVAGVGSLLSGIVYSFTSWYSLILLVSGMMMINIIMFGVSWNIKAQIEESIRLAELEEAELEEFDSRDCDSPIHSGENGNFDYNSDSNSGMGGGGAGMEMKDVASGSAADKRHLDTNHPVDITISHSSVPGRTTLYHVEPIDRVNRYSTSGMGRVTCVGPRPTTAGGSGSGSGGPRMTSNRMTNAGGGARMSTLDRNGETVRIPLSAMFVPAPIYDPDDEIRISVFSPV